MGNSVVIKGNKHGIVVLLDEKVPFMELKKDVVEKFRTAARFFNNADMAISFEGRKLSLAEEKELIDLITEHTDLNIVYVMDNDKEREEYFKAMIEERLARMSSNPGQFHMGTLRSGQVIESEGSLTVIGDVNVGATVVAKGNIIILGALKGTVYAGANGDERSFVVALDMQPMQIRIGDVIARSNDEAPAKVTLKNVKVVEPKIAIVDGTNIYIEKLDKNTIQDMKTN